MNIRETFEGNESKHCSHNGFAEVAANCDASLVAQEEIWIIARFRKTVRTRPIKALPRRLPCSSQPTTC
jgi:hypothetical protein